MLQNIGLPGMIVILVVVLVLFGRGRVGRVLAEFGDGISNFRRQLRAGDPASDPAAIAHSNVGPAAKTDC